MKKRLNWPSAIALALCGLCIGVVITYTGMNRYFQQTLAQQEAVSSTYGIQTGKLTQILAILDYYFVEDVDQASLVDAAADGMVEGTGDRWSRYISLDEIASYNEQVTNSYVGVGITITQEEELETGFRVVQVVSGGPADQAGVRTGDILAAVEDAAVLELGMDETKARVRGEEGTSVRLTFLREDEGYYVTLKRAKVDVAVAAGELLTDTVGLVTIENFDQGCCQQTIAAIHALSSQGAQAIIFDVRNNPGGLRSELTALLDFLLPAGTIFQSVDYKGDESIDVSGADYLDMPMAVLVNENSYSAAEYFAACLQEYGAAKVVGAHTSGKGYYQQAFSLSDGSAVSISTGAYYTPSGKSLAGVGVTPDVEIALDEEAFALLYYDALERAEDDQLQGALELLQ